jgi:hypothetical protein
VFHPTELEVEALWCHIACAQTKQSMKCSVAHFSGRPTRICDNVNIQRPGHTASGVTHWNCYHCSRSGPKHNSTRTSGPVGKIVCGGAGITVQLQIRQLLTDFSRPHRDRARSHRIVVICPRVCRKVPPKTAGKANCLSTAEKWLPACWKSLLGQPKAQLDSLLDTGQCNMSFCKRR